MDFLTIYTNAHIEKLSETASCLSYSETGKHDVYDTITIRRQDFDSAVFFNLLTSIAFEQNAAVNNSPGVTKRLYKSLSQAVVEQEKKNLCEYVNENLVLNLEGYVRFRMTEFHNHVNFLLYAIIKNLFKGKKKER